MSINILLILAAMITLTKAFLVARGSRFLRIKNESINVWLILTAIVIIATIFTGNVSGLIFAIPVIDLFLIFCFYLQPTFRVSKYIEILFVPLNIIYLLLIAFNF